MFCISKILLLNKTEGTLLQTFLSVVILTLLIWLFWSQRLIAKFKNRQKRTLRLVLNDCNSD